MNFIDISFLLTLVGMLALGFFQGTIRLTILIVAFYLSLVLAGLYFPWVGGWLAHSFGTASFVANYIAFGLVSLISFILITIGGFYTFRYAQFPGQLQFVDRTLGMLLGLILATLWLGLTAVMLWNMFVTQNAAAAINFPIMRWLDGSIKTSGLLNLFATHVLPKVYSVVQPILPTQVRSLFEVNKS